MISGPERIILLCTGDESAMESVEALAAVGFTAVRCLNVRELEMELSPSVVAVILDATLPRDQTYAIYRHLRQDGRVPFLVLLPPSEPGTPNWVMEVDHGEQEAYARQPLTIPELVLRLNALLIRNGVVAPSSVAFASTSSTQVASALAGYGKVICVFGAHGGVGKTTVSVHLAMGLQHLMQARVAFVDGDLWMGDSMVILNVTPNRTILDATINGIPNDPEVWTRVLVDHPSGVKLLAPPIHLEDVERVPDGALAAAAQALRRYFDYVVVDLDDALTEGTLSVLETADQILVVMTPELSTVRNTIRLLTTASDIGLKERIRVVLNRAGSGLEARQVESVIPSTVAVSVPSDGRLFVAAVNTGKTLFEIDAAARSPVRRAFEALARDVAAFGRPRTARRAGERRRFGIRQPAPA